MLFQLLLVNGLFVAESKKSCPGDTERYQCGTMCELKCGEPAPELCAQGCVKNACQCPPGMWRTSKDLCVPMEDDCFFQVGDGEDLPTAPAPVCPGETVWQECPYPCADKCGEDRPKWCKALQKVMSKYPEAICAPADCACPGGLFRTADDQCIEKKLCKKALSCPGDTKFMTCGSMCEGKCGEETPLICALGCETNVCQCPSGTKRTPDDRCVESEDQCPKLEAPVAKPEPKCPGDTIFMKCGSSCEGKCGEKTPEVCADVCVDDVCQCPLGTLRTRDNRCVKAEKDCGPSATCPGETVFMECGSKCEAKCGWNTPAFCELSCEPDVCQCPAGTFRTEDDRCVKDEADCETVALDVNQCPGDTVFMECGSMCEGKCGVETPDFCGLACVTDVCQCPAGTLRTDDDRCVESQDDCKPKPAPVCPGDTIFMECGSMCEGKCGEKTPEMCAFGCEIDVCQCPLGTLRTKDDRCVLQEEDCAPVCPGETVFMECGSACEGRCGEDTPEVCVDMCVDNVCQCPAGTKRTKDDRCVKDESKCPVKCPGDTLFFECGTMCEKKCNSDDNTDVCNYMCNVNVCQCPVGTFRTEDDKCVKEEKECPPPTKPQCPGETQFYECGTMCENVCGEPEVHKCNKMCNRDVCQCPPGTVRTQDDKCVKSQLHCPVPKKVCPGETKFTKCGTMCENKCGEPRQELCDLMCKEDACQCPSGMFRTADDRCVRSERDCPKDSVPELEAPRPTCPGDTKFFECGTMCENKCGEPAAEKCNKKCNVNVCQCPRGFFRTHDDKCVSQQDKCPGPCPGDLVRQKCGTPCQRRCGPFGAEEDPEFCKPLNNILDKIKGELCTEGVCQCPPGQLRTADNRCVDTCPTPSNPYPTFFDFQEACRSGEGEGCAKMGCGWAAAGTPCPVPAEPKNIKCNRVDGGECWKLGCNSKIGRRSGKVLCKGEAMKWSSKK